MHINSTVTASECEEVKLRVLSMHAHSKKSFCTYSFRNALLLLQVVADAHAEHLKETFQDRAIQFSQKIHIMYMCTGNYVIISVKNP